MSFIEMEIAETARNSTRDKSYVFNNPGEFVPLNL